MLLFKTKDLPLATVLKTEGMKMVATERDKRETHFIFKDKERCETIKISYYNGELLQDPLKVLTNYNSLKGLALS